MAEIKLKKRYKYVGDIFPKLIDIGFDIEMATDFLNNIKDADVVEVVRCKDCIYFQPDFVLTNEGNRRPYTEEEIQKGKMVTSDIGINCSSRCERFGYWEENSIPVWFNENDFCSYGKRTPKERGGEK